MIFFIENEHGVVVDTANNKKLAIAIATYKDKAPRTGKLPCRVYTFDGKGRKVYLS